MQRGEPAEQDDAVQDGDGATSTVRVVPPDGPEAGDPATTNAAAVEPPGAGEVEAAEAVETPAAGGATAAEPETRAGEPEAAKPRPSPRPRTPAAPAVPGPEHADGAEAAESVEAPTAEPETAAAEPETAAGEPEEAAGEPEEAAAEPEEAAAEPERSAAEPETAKPRPSPRPRTPAEPDPETPSGTAGEAETTDGPATDQEDSGAPGTAVPADPATAVEQIEPEAVTAAPPDAAEDIYQEDIYQLGAPEQPWKPAPEHTTPAPLRQRRRSKRVRTAPAVALMLALMILFPAFVVRVYMIPSESMETTLHGCKGCDNDRVLVDRLVYRFTDPTPGEVVVFTAGPEIWRSSEVQDPGSGNPIIRALESVGERVGIQTPAGSDFVKRVIAVGGQTVSCCDSRNRIVVDGFSVDESYLYFSPEAGGAAQKPFPQVRVPKGEVFVMGDNRNDSLDSRALGNGPIPVSALAGKARVIVFPFSRVARIDGANPQRPPRF